MPDRRKSGRKIKTDHSLEADLTRDYIRIHRSHTLHALYQWRRGWPMPETIHMFLARKYSIPCQRVRTILSERVPGYEWRKPNERGKHSYAYSEWDY